MVEDLIIRESSGLTSTIDKGLYRAFEGLGKPPKSDAFNRSKCYAAWEWMIPASVIVLFSKPFFDSFMKKLGEEAGQAVVSALKRQFSRVAVQPERIIDAKSMRAIAAVLENEPDADPTVIADRLNLGKPLLPLEIRIQSWSFLSRDLIYLNVKFRFVFPIQISSDDFEKSIFILESKQDAIFQALVDETISAQYGRLDTGSALSVEAVFDPEFGDWVSFSTMRKREAPNAK